LVCKDPNRARAAAATLLDLLALPAVMCAQVPRPERVAAATEMMQIAGVAKQFDEAMPYLMRQLAQSFTAIAPDRGTEIGEVLNSSTAGGTDRRDRRPLCRRMSSPPSSPSTKSPVGMKFVAVQPEIMRQSMMAGQHWGARLGREIEEEVRKELKKRSLDL
jgi:hypothetical protein